MKTKKNKQEPELLYRILDANFNRAQEGLRVIEDIFRFSRKGLPPARIRKIRHSLSLVLKKESRAALVFRNTKKDPGKDSFQNRYSSVRGIVQANFRRAEESLRVLEEVLRFFSSEKSMRLKKLRFEVYAAEKKASA